MSCGVCTTAVARDTIDVYESLHSYVLVGQAAKGETFDLTGPVTNVDGCDMVELSSGGAVEAAYLEFLPPPAVRGLVGQTF